MVAQERNSGVLGWVIGLAVVALGAWALFKYTAIGQQEWTAVVSRVTAQLDSNASSPPQPVLVPPPAGFFRAGPDDQAVVPVPFTIA